MTVDLDETVELPEVGKDFLMAESLLATCKEEDCDEVSLSVEEVEQGPKKGASSSGVIGPQGKSDVVSSGEGVVALQAGGVSESWVFDSGSSGHVTPNASQMKKLSLMQQISASCLRKATPDRGVR